MRRRSSGRRMKGKPGMGINTLVTFILHTAQIFGGPDGHTGWNNALVIKPLLLITMTLHQNCTLKIVAYLPDCPSRTGVYPLVAAHCREHCAQQAPGQALDPTLRSWADQGPRLEGVVFGSPSTWSAAGS